MTQWTYAFASGQTPEELHKVATEWGAKGWEMVGICRSDIERNALQAKYTAFFKRPDGTVDDG
jgi:hypothetical protein